MLAPLLGVRLELLLERGEFCERRVRIGGLVAAVAVSAALDVFGAQIGIAVGPLPAVGTLDALAMHESVATRGTVGSRGTIGARRTVCTIRARQAVGALSMPRAVVAAGVLRTLGALCLRWSLRAIRGRRLIGAAGLICLRDLFRAMIATSAPATVLAFLVGGRAFGRCNGRVEGRRRTLA